MQTTYATFGSTSDFKNCRPSEIFIYADEDPLSINDAALEVIAASPEAIDFPTVRHGDAACFSFADGHTELHKWQSGFFALGAVPTGVKIAQTTAEKSDWFWLAWHASRSLTTGTVP